MLTYNSYTFESKLESLNEIKQTSDNEVVWSRVKDLIPESEKKFWHKLDTLPKNVKPLLATLLNKTFSLIKNITTEQANKLLNKLLETVDKLVKEPKLKKKLVYVIVFFVLATTTLTVSSLDVTQSLTADVSDVVKEIEPIADVKFEVEDDAPDFIPNKLTPYSQFLDTLAFKESSDTWDAVRYVTKKDKKIPVYVGKYQFGNIAFRDIKSKVRVKDFAKNPNIWSEAQQDKDILELLKNNHYYLRHTKWFKGYKHYLGQTINGVKITKSGVLAASHLVGNKNVKKFLKTNGEKDYADGNGTKCSDYMKTFSDYEIPIN